MRWLVVCVSMLGLATASLIGVAPANAGLSGTARHEEPGGANCGADGLRNRVSFNHTSDDLTSRDDCNDSWGAYGEILIASSGRHEVCNNLGGNGTAKTCAFDFAENKPGVILASSYNGNQFQGAGNQVGIVT